MNKEDLELTSYKNRVIDLVLITGIVFSYLAITSVFFRDYPDNIGISFYTQCFFIFLGSIVVVYRKKIRLIFKVYVIIIALLAVFVNGLFNVGFLASAKVYMIVVPVLVSFIFSYKKAIIWLLIFLLVYSICGFLFTRDFLTYSLIADKYIIDANTWLTDGIILFLSTFVLLYVSTNYNKELFNKIKIIRDKNEELKLSERKYKEIFNSTTDAIFIQDSITGIVIDVNEAMLDMYGYADRHEVINQNIWKFSATKNGYTEKKALEKIAEAQSQPAIVFEWLARKKNRDVFWVEVSLRNTSIGGENRLLASVRNINDRKQYEFSVKERDKIFETIFSKSADGITLIQNDKFTACNDSIIRLLELDSRKDIIGKTPWNVSPEFQPDGERSIEKANRMLQIALKKGYYRFEWLHNKKNGNDVFVDIVLTPVTLNNQQIIHCVWRDITEKKQQEIELENHRNNLENLVREKTTDLETKNEELEIINEELLKKNDIINNQNTKLKRILQDLKTTQLQLLQSEKMASLGILTAGVAHEINNPLNYILGACVGLEKHFKKSGEEENAQVKLYLNTLRVGVKRASDIVQGLNQFSRDSKTYTEVCDIHSILDNCLTMLSNQLKHRIVIEKYYSARVPATKGNVGKLHQAFINILSNASQAIKEEGRIAIRTQKKGSNIIVNVADTGVGISEENMQNVINPFYTTKEPGKGVGLGLSITYNIIQEHKGQLEFKSEVSKGTTVVVMLPII